MVDVGMRFEMTLRLLFGHDAYQTASVESSSRGRCKWLRKAVKKLTQIVNSLDTVIQHKEMLLTELKALSTLLKEKNNPSWDLVYRLLRLAIRLVGYESYESNHGLQCHTPIYTQVPYQYYLRSADALQHYYNKQNAVGVRRRVAEVLRKEGMDDFQISIVLNTSEYAVKQLRSKKSLKSTRPG